MKKLFALLQHNTINCLLEAPLHIGHPFIGLSICHQKHTSDYNLPLHPPQCAKKVFSDGLGQVDFAVWLVNSVCN